MLERLDRLAGSGSDFAFETTKSYCRKKEATQNSLNVSSIGETKFAIA